MIRRSRRTARVLPFLAALLLASGLVVVARPEPAAAETLAETPIIEVTPYCFPTDGIYTITVAGHSFAAGALVNVADYVYYQKPDDTEQVTTDEYGTFSVTLTVTTNFYYYSNLIKAIYANDRSGTTVAQTYFSYCPSGPKVTRLVPPCSDDEIPQIHVMGTGWAATPSDAIINFKVVGTFGGPQYGDNYAISPRDSFDVRWSPGVPLPAADYDVIVTQNSSDGLIENYEQLRFHTPCPQATITPECAQAGAPPNRLTISISGTGFDDHNLDNGADVEIIFDPDGKPQTFFYEAREGLVEGGSFGPVEIQPYARPDGSYTVEMRQSHNGDGYTVRDYIGTFTVPCFTPTVSANPSCGPPQIIGDVPKIYSTTVTGTHFAPGQNVTVVFDPDLLAGVDYPPATITSVTGRDGSFSLAIETAYRPPGTYRILAYQDLRSGRVEGSTTFRVPCRVLNPTLTVDPICAPAASGKPDAYTLKLAGAGFARGFVELVFDPTGTPETGGVQTERTGSFATTLVVDGRPPGAYSVIARQTTVLGPLAEVTVSLLVPCEGLILRITPSAGPPGFVARADGFGFPALSLLELHWDRGIGAGQPITVLTDQNGNFTRQLNIFHHDFTGPRNLTVGQPDVPDAYPDLVAPYTVTMGTVTPPFVIDNPTGPSDPIILRR